jgi:hypothetical protein
MNPKRENLLVAKRKCKRNISGMCVRLMKRSGNKSAQSIYSAGPLMNIGGRKNSLLRKSL